MQTIDHFYSQYDRPEKVCYENNSGEILVERGQSIPVKQRVEEFLSAGRRLMQVRQEQYDFAPGTPVDENAYDPTRRLDYDIAEASQTMLSLEAKKLAAQKNKKGVVDGKSTDGSVAKKDVIHPDPAANGGC